MNSRFVLDPITKPYQDNRNHYLQIKSIENCKKLGNQKAKC